MALLHTGYCTNQTRSNKTVYLYLCAPSSALSLQWLLRFQVVNNGLVRMCYKQVLCLVARAIAVYLTETNTAGILRQFLCKRQFMWFALLLLYIYTVGRVHRRRMAATSLEELLMPFTAWWAGQWDGCVSSKVFFHTRIELKSTGGEKNGWERARIYVTFLAFVSQEKPYLEDGKEEDVTSCREVLTHVGLHLPKPLCSELFCQLLFSALPQRCQDRVPGPLPAASITFTMQPPAEDITTGLITVMVVVTLHYINHMLSTPRWSASRSQLLAIQEHTSSSMWSRVDLESSRMATPEVRIDTHYTLAQERVLAKIGGHFGTIGYRLEALMASTPLLFTLEQLPRHMCGWLYIATQWDAHTLLPQRCSPHSLGVEGWMGGLLRSEKSE